MGAKKNSIDAYSIESLKASAHVIYPGYITLLTIRPSEPITDLLEILPFFDFDTEGSFVSYPKSSLIQSYKHRYFYIISLKSYYSLN